MNILLTTLCNKGCSFCFARHRNQAIQHMSDESFQQLVAFVLRSRSRPHLKLLGGEPTLHPHFTFFVEQLIHKGIFFTLISNGLYADTHIRQTILQAIDQGILKSILFNAAELTNERLELFRENYQAVLPYAKKTDFSLTCGITFRRDCTAAEDIAYVRQLLQKLEIHQLRLSLDFPGHGAYDDFFINRHDYGDRIMAILDVCREHHVIVSGDCIVYPCMFQDAFFVRKKLSHFLEQTKFVCQPQVFPLDVYPDLSYFHCYPAAAFGGESILHFENAEQLNRDMQLRKTALMSMLQPPEQCRGCEYFKNRECAGLCLGCNMPQSGLQKTFADSVN